MFTFSIRCMIAWLHDCCISQRGATIQCCLLDALVNNWQSSYRLVGGLDALLVSVLRWNWHSGSRCIFPCFVVCWCLHTYFQLNGATFLYLLLRNVHHNVWSHMHFHLNGHCFLLLHPLLSPMQKGWPSGQEMRWKRAQHNRCRPLPAKCLCHFGEWNPAAGYTPRWSSQVWIRRLAAHLRGALSWNAEPERHHNGARFLNIANSSKSPFSRIWIIYSVKLRSAVCEIKILFDICVKFQ